MNPHDRRPTRWTAIATTALLAAAAAAWPRRAAAVDPTTRPGTRSDAAMTADLKRVNTDLNAALSQGVISDPAKRAAAAPTVIPLIKQEQALLHEYGAAHHTEAMYSNVLARFDSMLYLLGDKETVVRVDHAAGSPVAADGLPAKAVRLNARWLGAGRDAAAQQAVADELELLDTAHPDSNALTSATVTFANTAVSTDLRSHLGDVAKRMTSPMAARLAAATKDQDESERKLAALTGKPFTLAATTVDGKPFTSADYRGKVVLVDFWATWCGPCKAELPRVKDVYGKYHDRGLEIIGVSNDYTAGALKKYTAENGMPWVELLDASAAADHHWNPATLGYGIRGIPTMFLIDKKGVLRTVQARQDMETLIPALLAE